MALKMCVVMFSEKHNTKVYNVHGYKRKKLSLIEEGQSTKLCGNIVNGKVSA